MNIFNKIIIILTFLIIITAFSLEIIGLVMIEGVSVSQFNQPNTFRVTTSDIKVGTGAEALPGKIVTVHYTGTLTNGTVFDSSLNRGQPFSFILGAGQVIKGWDRGVAGMKVGGTRVLTIPPHLAYGEQAAGIIPPNSTLIFQVELLAVEDQPQNQ